MSRTCADTSGPTPRRAWWSQGWCGEGCVIGTRLSTSRASDRGRSFGSGLVELAVISMINTSAHARVVHVTAAVYSGVSRATRAFFFLLFQPGGPRSFRLRHHTGSSQVRSVASVTGRRVWKDQTARLRRAGSFRSPSQAKKTTVMSA